MPRLALLLLLPLAWAGVERKPDVVTLTGGRTVEGIVLYEDERELVLRVGSSTERYERERVADVSSAVRSLDLVLDRHAALPREIAVAFLDLARFARARGLESEARLFAWKVLTLEPENAAAHELLGHRKTGSRWLAPVGARNQPLERVLELRRGWGDAWELATTHYRLRTNLELDAAIDVALDLERVYRGWFQLFGRELGMQEVLEPLKVHVHADATSFPEIGDGRTAWFDRADRTLRIDASGGLNRWSLAHEAVHQLLDATAESPHRAPSGAVPGWLHEGLAEYVAAATSGPPGRMRMTPGALAEHHLALHRAEAEPYDLARVLAFDSSDFNASSRAGLKYAQAYSLVAYLLDGDGGAHRPGFLDYLRGVWVGQSSSTHLQDALGTDKADLERAWKAWVAAPR